MRPCGATVLHTIHLWFSGSVGQGNLPTAAKVVQLGWEFSLVIYPGSTPVGNATLVVANVLTCNKYSHYKVVSACCTQHVCVVSSNKRTGCTHDRKGSH
jgi:hypothetical protein